MLLNNFTDILNNINDDKLAMDNLVESSLKYALQLGIDSESDFNQVHKIRLLLRKFHSNPNFQTKLYLNTFN